MIIVESIYVGFNSISNDLLLYLRIVLSAVKTCILAIVKRKP